MFDYSKNNVCILNVSCGGWYPRGQHRLFESLDQFGFKGKKLFWKDRFPPGCPDHKKIPYAFKPYAFLEAKRRGYDIALWIDSALWAIKPIDYYLDKILKDGHVLLNNGWKTGQWCSDAALKTLRITREEAMDMPHLMANVMGLDFRNKRSIDFFEEWFRLSNDGITFPGSWTNKNNEVSKDPRVLGHRHDQTAASVISIRLGMNWTIDNTGVFYYDGRPMEQVPSNIILLARGM